MYNLVDYIYILQDYCYLYISLHWNYIIDVI